MTSLSDTSQRKYVIDDHYGVLSDCVRGLMSCGDRKRECTLTAFSSEGMTTIHVSHISLYPSHRRGMNYLEGSWNGKHVKIFFYHKGASSLYAG